MGGELTHLDEHGRASMVDVGSKDPMRREAIAEGFFCAAAETLDKIETGDMPKGEALSVARIAGIQAAKRCESLIPLCHQLPLDSVAIDFKRDDPQRIKVTATVSTTAKTGVEMEALTAVSIAALTLWDMTKAVDKDLKIEGITLVCKTKTPV